MMDSSQANTWQNKMLGRYRLLRLLGRGGMGEVWLAEDAQLRRQVAVKLLPSVFASDHNYLQDFEREAQAAAALEHPHILPVHDFGEQRIAEDEVVTYLITPYLTGGALSERIRHVNGPLPTAEALSYLRQGAEAIDYAHSQNVLHRDIKPANMLLQEGWLFLADFGIAKLLTSTTRRTRTHAGSGTPEYMAPEQARGKAEAASDRYSFAMTAYQLCTGKVAFKGNTPYETLIQQVTKEPPSPRQFNPAIPETIEQAILQGLAKQPGDRPASCMALVHALEQGWQMSASAQGGLEPAILVPWSTYDTPQSYKQQFTPSNMPSTQPATSSAAAQTPIIATPQRITEPSGNIVTAPASRFPAHNIPLSGPQGPLPALQTPTSKVPQGKITRRAVLIGGAAAATLAISGGAVAFSTLSHSNSPANRPTAHPTPAPGPKNLMAGIPLLSLTAHTQGVSVARWDPTGRYLATAGEDAYVMLWDLAGYLQKGSTGLQTLSTPARKWKLASPILTNAMCWSADGQTIAVVTGESRIFLYSVFNNAGMPQVYQDAGEANSANPPVHISIAWSPTGNIFATPSYRPQQTQQQVDLWRIGQTSNPLLLKSDATGPARTSIIDSVHPFNAPVNVNMTGWSADGSLLAGHTNFGTVTIWQTAAGTVNTTLNLPQRPTKENPTYVLGESVTWSPRNPHLLAASDLDIATLWDVQQNKLVLALKSTDPAPFLTGLIWSSNGRYLAGSYAESPRVYIWDVQAAELNPQPGAAQPQKLFFPQSGVHVHTAAIADIAWSPDGRYIASASQDTTVVVWRVDAS